MPLNSLLKSLVLAPSEASYHEFCNGYSSVLLPSLSSPSSKSKAPPSEVQIFLFLKDFFEQFHRFPLPEAYLAFFQDSKAHAPLKFLSDLLSDSSVPVHYSLEAFLSDLKLSEVQNLRDSVQS